jgi:hypothetical protein
MIPGSEIFTFSEYIIADFYRIEHGERKRRGGGGVRVFEKISRGGVMNLYR